MTDLEKIDEIAQQFNDTHDKKCFAQFVKFANPFIYQIIGKACQGSSWDTKELYSILLIDMWRLLKRWEPDSRPFHWLMLRQLRNKTINYVNGKVGRIHKICVVCGEHQPKDHIKRTCIKCNSDLRVSEIICEPFENLNFHVPNTLNQIANNQLVERLLNIVKGDTKTHKILTMLLEGESKTKISKTVGIAQNALNNRLKKCKKILNEFIKEEI